MILRGQQGVVLIAVVLLCLGTAVLIAGLAAATTLVRSGWRAETEGRALAARAEEGLVAALVEAEAGWRPCELDLGDGVVVTLTPAAEAPGWVLQATATAVGTRSAYSVSALMERGADGLDLPARAAVAGTLAWEEGRSAPLVRVARGATPALVSVVGLGSEPPLGDGVVLERVGTWTFDGKYPLADGARNEDAGVRVIPPGLNAGTFLAARGAVGAGASAEAPVVLIGAEGSVLEAAGLGEFYGVLVAGAGGILLDGTSLHGAAFTEGALRFGVTGQIAVDEPVLEWARRGCFTRARLVPGTRRDTVSPLN